VLVRLSFQQTPAAADLALLNAALSAGAFQTFTAKSTNSASLRILPLPLLSSVRPSAIFNLAVVTSLKVTGEHFVDSNRGL